MCFSPGKVLVPWPRGNGTDQAWSRLLYCGLEPVTSPLGFSFCIWTCRVGTTSLPRLFPVLTFWGALPPPQSMWPLGKGPVNGIRGVERGRVGRERWDSETRKKSPYSRRRKRRGWNAWAIQCAVFFESSWHVVGAVSTHQMRVDFWECLVASGGREARC